MSDGLRFSVHDLIHVHVAPSFPYAGCLNKELSHFKVARSSRCDLLITERLDTVAQAADIQEDGVRVLFRNDRIVLACGRDPLPFVIPLLQWLLLQRGYSFVHAAGVAINGLGVLLPAAGGVGKTTSVSRLCHGSGASFLGDDATILGNGDMLSFPKPLFVYPYHREVFPHLFRNKRKIVVPARLSQPVAAVRRALRPLLRRYPRVEDLARRYTPEHMHVDAHEALPGVPFCDRCPLSAVIFLERSAAAAPRLTAFDVAGEVDRLGATLFVEMGESAQRVLKRCALAGAIPLHEYFGRMHHILRRALGGAPAHRLEIPAAFDSRQTGMAVARAVAEVLPAGAT